MDKEANADDAMSVASMGCNAMSANEKHKRQREQKQKAPLIYCSLGPFDYLTGESRHKASLGEQCKSLLAKYLQKKNNNNNNTTQGRNSREWEREGGALRVVRHKKC